MAWIGVVVYTVLGRSLSQYIAMVSGENVVILSPFLCNAVAMSTAGAFIAGFATLFFSGTCAVMGTFIISCKYAGVLLQCIAATIARNSQQRAGSAVY